MSAVTARVEAEAAALDAIASVRRQGVTQATANYLVIRSAALAYSDALSGLAAAEKLRALADEIGGGA